MRRLPYTVPPEWDGAMVKEFAKQYLGFSTRVLAGLKRAPGGITLNGEPVFTTARLQAGDALSFALPEGPAPSYPAADLPLPTVFENEDFLVVDKPVGMPVHPSPGHDRDSLLHAAAFHYKNTGQTCPICPLYRLDKDTSGLLALGKHRLAVSAVKAEKLYFALCQGTLSGSGTVDVPISLEPGSRIKRQCGAGQRAVTHWRALAQGQGHTLVAVRLETGRTHQIRAHFAHMGFPLAGDDLYGGSLAYLDRQALHCGRLRLSSRALPMDREFTSDLPAQLREAFPWLPPAEEIVNVPINLDNTDLLARQQSCPVQKRGDTSFEPR